MDREDETVLVLAGDIGLPHYPSCNARFEAFIKNVASRFKGVILIEGNHEHYGGDFPKTYRAVENLLDEFLGYRPNVHHLNNSCVVIDDVAFIGATLWTDCDNRNPHANYLWTGMADYKKIRTGPEHETYQRKFNAADTAQEWFRSKNYIFEEIRRQELVGNKVVVVTHHGVSSMSCHADYKNDAMNMFFYSEMTVDFMDLNPDLIIHGHTHRAFDYYLDSTKEISKTRVIVNPRGYPGENKNIGENELKFDPFKRVEL